MLTAKFWLLLDLIPRYFRGQTVEFLITSKLLLKLL